MDEVNTIESIYQTLSIHKGLVIYNDSTLHYDIAKLYNKLLDKDFPVVFVDDATPYDIIMNHRLLFVCVRDLGQHIRRWLRNVMCDIDIVILTSGVDISFFKRMARCLPANDKGRLIIRI